MKNKMKCIICWTLIPLMILATMVFFKTQSIPSTIFVREGQKLKSNYIIKLDSENLGFTKNKLKKRDGLVNVSLLGVLPIKSVAVKSVPPIYVYPGGKPIGVRLSTKGVLVIALSDVETQKGKITSPSAKAGIQIGDIITKVDNKVINSSEELISAINGNRNIKITLERNKEILEKDLTPLKDKNDNFYKIGLWVRDSTSGIGTLTFYEAKSKKFAALGHPITDVDTGSILRINTGEIVESSIISIKKGQKGNPGELRGVFLNENKTLGQVYKNVPCGIYGESDKKLICNKFSKPIQIGLKSEIQEGPAKVLTTIEGTEPKLYDISIEKLLPQDKPGSKSMVIKVTDKELLNKTGGIVQGMSGSPIIQNNKLVGAITHVLINKPDVGYGVYIEWMIKDSNILSK